jgi:hypothetical protein|tara:strand:+ start:252 stop:566 length:315 start_codon:yes stop_codon:yes gene_type:complete
MNQPMMNQPIEQNVCDKNCKNDCCKHESEYEYEDDEEYDKWKYSIYSAIVFLIISSPYTYMLVNSMLGSLVSISKPTGCPTTVGLLLHAVVFMLIIRGMMELDI